MKISLSELESFPFLEETLLQIHSLMAELNLPWLIIGALARDIQFRLIHQQKAPYRATRDADIAVMIESWPVYQTLAQAMAIRGFTNTGDTQKFCSKEGMTIDIVPFGAIEKERKISWPPKFDVIMSSIGFTEAFNHSIKVEFADSKKINVLSLEGLFLLKTIAWGDRKERKDIEDLNIVLSNYLDIAFDEIMDSIDNFDDPEEGAAHILGRKIAEIISENNDTRIGFCQILREQIEKGEVSDFIKVMTPANHDEGANGSGWKQIHKKLQIVLNEVE